MHGPLFARGPLANKNLFAGGPPTNKKLFIGGIPANMKLFVGALSILCSPEWSYAVLSSLSLYCVVLYCIFKGLYCCITVLSLWFCVVVQSLVWSYFCV